MFVLSLLALVLAEDYSSYYNDVDSNYDIEPSQPEQNETILDEIIVFGNETLDLSDLQTYEVVNDSQLPDLQPVRFLFSVSQCIKLSVFFRNINFT